MTSTSGHRLNHSFKVIELMEVAYFILFTQIITFFVGIYGQCPWKNGTLPSVANGYTANNKNLTLYNNGLAYGSFDVVCNVGYQLDSTTSGRITCLTSGSWSQPLPKCISTGRCPIPTLFTFLQTAAGIQFDQSASFIYNNGIDNDLALGGSNITVRCATGYQNIGGPLVILCTQANSWTTFPNCVSTSSSTTTTTAAPRCPVSDNTWTFDNGYLSNTSGLALYSDNTAKGYVVVSCSAGYVIDSVSNGQYKCNNGVWSSRPYCTKTARCSLSKLNSFLNNASNTIGLQISSQSLLTNSQGSDEILIGSYILFSCENGYTAQDNNNFNVTCNANGQWSSYPICTSTATNTSSGRCPLNNGELPTVANGYRSNVDHVVLYTSGVAEGYYDINCDAGYTLDPTIGGRITCLPSGSWSQPLPQCLSTGRCPIPTLSTFLQTSPGIRFDTSLSFIFTDGVNKDQALGGSNITVRCATGYQNIGGPLVILCTRASSWTTFPNCVSTSSSTITTTTTATTIPLCPVNDDTWTFDNGYLSDTSGLTLYSDDTAKGYIVVSCSAGYVIDPVSNGQYKCNNGVWSSRPYCTETARCSYTTLKNFVGNSTAVKGLKIASQKLSVISKSSDEILVGSYVLFYCNTGYTATNSYNLNVTCNTNGQWSSFPSCTPPSTTASANH